MDEEDYFGDITVPLDEEEEDVANDLTFGDTSDIKAGDDSDAAWNPNHLTLSSKIEAEKEALQRNRVLIDSAGANGHEPSTGTTSPLRAIHHSNGARSSPQEPNDTTPSPWDLLQRSLLQSQVNTPQSTFQRSPLQPSLQTLQSLDRHGPPQQLSQPTHAKNQPSAQKHLQQPLSYQAQPSLQQPLQQPLRQQSLQQQPLQQQPLQQQPLQQPFQQPPQQLLQQPLQQPVQSVHPHLPFHSPFEQISAPQLRGDQIRGPVSPQEMHQVLVSYQQQQTNLLLRQHQETADKQLREAERAQQAGVSFDRAKFDQHQEATRQMILSDHYARLRQVQLQVFQYQQLQQVAGQKLENLMEPSAHDLLSKLNGSTSQIPEHYESSEQRLPPMHVGIEDSLNGTDARKDGRDPIPERYRNGNTPFLDSAIRNMRDEDIENMPRMLEIEREMAKAGLGPRGGKSEHRKNAFDTFVPSRNLGNEESEQKTKRRLESMTDRDQELVFRAHLRQIETSEVYKDDYYNSVLKMKEKLGDHEVFAGLADRVQSLRLRGKEKVTSKPIRTKGSRRSGQSSISEDKHVASSPPHSDQNIRALANALGTVQSWNPKAPRRVMDFSILEKKDNTDEGAQQKSLRDDERVHVRQEVERGYDIIATVHDIVRGENQHQPLGRTIQSLMSTLHLSEKRGDEADSQQHRHYSTRFFATMCVIPKGRRYLALILDLLDVPERMRVMSAIFENLGMVVFASKKAMEADTQEKQSHADLYSVMTRIVADSDIASQDCLHVLESFITSHVTHRDAFLTTFRSAVGSKLIFLCMQRISAGLSRNTLSEEVLLTGKIDRFSEVFTQCLQDIFDGAESVKRVWEVSASLDALSRAESRGRYRAELNRLLRSGLIPPPPER